MQIFGTLNSPYTRVARVVAKELGLPFSMADLFWRKSPQETFQANPAGRVPILVDGDLHLFESRVIVEYLCQLPQAQFPRDFRDPAGPKRWQEQNVVTLSYAILDAGGILRNFADLPAGSHPYVARAEERVQHCLTALDAMAADGWLVDDDQFGLAEISVVTALEAARGARFLPAQRFETLERLGEALARRPSLAETTPHFN